MINNTTNCKDVIAFGKLLKLRLDDIHCLTNSGAILLIRKFDEKATHFRNNNFIFFEMTTGDENRDVETPDRVVKVIEVGKDTTGEGELRIEFSIADLNVQLDPFGYGILEIRMDEFRNAGRREDDKEDFRANLAKFRKCLELWISTAEIFLELDRDSDVEQVVGKLDVIDKKILLALLDHDCCSPDPENCASIPKMFGKKIDTSPHRRRTPKLQEKRLIKKGRNGFYLTTSGKYVALALKADVPS